MTTNRPPLPGTYDPKDWKCPNCKTLNFKKRMSCVACATSKPKGQVEVLKDWRTGKKDLGDNVLADWTCRICGKFNLAADKLCGNCQAVCPPKTNSVSMNVVDPDGRTGRAAGHFDRPDPLEERNAWNSDEEEFDEFGRKKRRGGAPASEKQRAALERLKQRRLGLGGARRTDRRSRSRS